MTTEDLSFLADCLRFIALPAVLLELLREETRTLIDSLLARRARQLLIGSGLVLVASIALAGLSLAIGHYLWISAGFVLFLIVALAQLEDTMGGNVALIGIIMAKFAAPLMIALAIGWAAFELLPRSLPLSDWSLFSTAQDHAQSVLGYKASLYQPDALTDDLWTRDSLVDAKKESLQSMGYFDSLFNLDVYRASLDQLMLPVAKGLSILIFVVLNLGVIALTLSAIIIPIALAVNAIYWLSNAIKAVFHIESKARYPVGAAALLAVAEIMSFVISAMTYFNWT